MRVQFQYTRDDYREMLAAYTQQRQKWAKQSQAKAGPLRVVLFIGVSACVFLVVMFGGTAGRALFPGVQNLWLLFLSPLIGTVVLLIGCLAAVRSAQMGRFSLSHGGLRTMLLVPQLIALMLLIVALPVLMRIAFPRPGVQAQVQQNYLWILGQEIVATVIPWALVATLVWILTYRQSSRQRLWEESVHLHRAKTFEAHPGGLTISDAVSHSDMKWLAVCEFAESRNLILLYISRQQFWAIPKRAFSEAELAEFRGLLQTEIGDGVRPGAFEVLPTAQMAEQDTSGQQNG